MTHIFSSSTFFPQKIFELDHVLIYFRIIKTETDPLLLAETDSELLDDPGVESLEIQQDTEAFRTLRRAGDVTCR
jgi:hypothetical protein